jgi:Fe-S oxidoreductase
MNMDQVLAETLLCQECGRCTGVCPVARAGLGFSPRKVIRQAGESRTQSPELDRALFACLGCDRCVTVCPSGLTISDLIIRLRQEAYQQGRTATPAHGGLLQSFMRMMATTPDRQHRLDWLDPSLRVSTSGDTILFVGCAPYFDRVFDFPGLRPVETARNAVRLLNRVGIEPILLDDERCCGHDLLWLGDTGNFRLLAERNLAQIAVTGAKRLVFSCPECLRTFKLDYQSRFGKSSLELLHISELLARELSQLDPGAMPGRVTFHDPCRLGRHLGIYDPPRELLRAVPGLELLEMKHSREQATCCGGTAWVECGTAVKCLQNDRLAEAVATGADRLVTACPKCDIHLRCALCGADSRTHPSIVNLIDLLAESLGLSGPEPLPESAVRADKGGNQDA